MRNSEMDRITRDAKEIHRINATYGEGAAVIKHDALGNNVVGIRDEFRNKPQSGQSSKGKESHGLVKTLKGLFLHRRKQGR